MTTNVTRRGPGGGGSGGGTSTAFKLVAQLSDAPSLQPTATDNGSGEAEAYEIQLVNGVRWTNDKITMRCRKAGVDAAELVQQVRTCVVGSYWCIMGTAACQGELV